MNQTKAWCNAQFVAAMGNCVALKCGLHGSTAGIVTVQARSPKNGFTPGIIELLNLHLPTPLK
jgi:hypothetical protein